MIKSPTLQDTQSFGTSVPAVVGKCNMPCCVVEEISICVTGATAILQSWSLDLRRLISKREEPSTAVCSEVTPVGREESIMNPRGTHGPHAFHPSSPGAFDVAGRLLLCKCSDHRGSYRRILMSNLAYVRSFKGVMEDISGVQLCRFHTRG